MGRDTRDLLALHLGGMATYLTALIGRLRNDDQSLSIFLASLRRGPGRFSLKPKTSRSSEPPNKPPNNFGRIRFDTYIGMALSNIVAFFIILTAAVTLHTHGILDIRNRRPGCQGARASGRQICFPALCHRNCRYRLSGRPRASGLRCLRGRRDFSLDRQP